MAQEWADGCIYKHRTDGDGKVNPQDYGFPSIGENIWAWQPVAGGHEIPERPIQMWYDEKSDYDYNTGQCTPGKVCGHYTTVSCGSYSS